ncbi:SDR family oxidoreductase [Hamadaea tsunoensis]|uniref:SDR family oxidoreductase n=1 Tax=Hamadaea tsunoensis TaxID=53368 RepID=UPI00042552C3|nr:NAD(P)H-binding protein [Hamadaea tsunoensis]
MASILVTGGTGTLGRPLVEILRLAGHDVRVFSRAAGGDLSTGAGLDAALAGGPVVVHCASDTKHAGKSDVYAARNLVRASGLAGVPHLVYISIVGIDRIPFGYYTRKLAVERLIEGGPVPWTILRATQFHELIDGIAGTLSRSPVMPVVKGVGFQPIAAAEVAAMLAELAEGEPMGRVRDVGGPEVRSLGDLVDAYKKGRRKRRLVVTLPAWGRLVGSLRAGANLAPQDAVGRQTWTEYLHSAR